MMVQAGTFMLPYRIWRALEGGLIEEFGSEAKTKIILEEEYGEDSLVMDQLVDKYVKFFRAIWHRNNWYFFMFVLCEILNCVVLFLNFWLTDVFLNGRFYSYGWDIIQYSRHSVILVSTNFSYLLDFKGGLISETFSPSLKSQKKIRMSKITLHLKRICSGE